jgi:MFS family permease
MNAWGAEVEQRHGGPIMSSFHAMFSLGTGLGAATGYVAVWIGQGVDPHFLLNGAVFGAAALSLTLDPWLSRVSRGRRGKAFARPSGVLVLVGLAAFCASVGEGAIADWSAVFLYPVTEASEAQAALGYAAFSIAMVIMRLAGDWVIQRLGPGTSARLSGLTAALGVVIVVLGPTLPLVLVGLAIMGFGYAVVAPLTFSRAALESGTSPSQTIASVATLNYGGMLVGPPLIGFVAKASSLPAAFVLLGALSIAITALGASLREPKAPGNV